MVGIAQPHDKLFKGLLSYRDVADALLRERLPPDFVAQLADGPPELADASFVDDQLREAVSDRIFRLRVRSREPRGAECLMEHKSAPDPLVPLQLLRYMVCIWDRAVRAGGGRDELPSIIPLVVYHGAQPWSVSPYFTGLVEPIQALGLRPPDFEMVVVDLGKIEDAQLSRNPTLLAGLLLLKYSSREAMQRAKLGEILEALRAAAPGFRPMGLLYIMETYESIDRAHLLGELGRAMPEHEEMAMSTVAQELRAEGKAEGKAEGRAEDLVRILERRFGGVPVEVQKRVATAKLPELDVWLDRAIDAATIDGVFGARH